MRAGWVRELLTSVTVTNPLATRTLLSSLIAKKEAANSENVAILQMPMTLKHSTTDVADWLAYFTGADRQRTAPIEQRSQVLRHRSRFCGAIKISVTPLDQAQDPRLLLPRSSLTVLPGLGHIPQIEDPIAFNSALVEVLRSSLIRAPNGR